MRKASKILEQYTGVGNRWGEGVNGDPEHTRLVLVWDDGEERVLWTGVDFDVLEFHKRKEKDAK